MQDHSSPFPAMKKQRGYHQRRLFGKLGVVGRGVTSPAFGGSDTDAIRAMMISNHHGQAKARIMVHRGRRDSKAEFSALRSLEDKNRM
jgi:hypothetical protein